MVACGCDSHFCPPLTSEDYEMQRASINRSDFSQVKFSHRTVPGIYPLLFDCQNRTFPRSVYRARMILSSFFGISSRRRYFGGYFWKYSPFPGASVTMQFCWTTEQRGSTFVLKKVSRWTALYFSVFRRPSAIDSAQEVRTRHANYCVLYKLSIKRDLAGPAIFATTSCILRNEWSEISSRSACIYIK